MNKVDKDKLEEAITGTFMWSFKKGDNVIYNFEVLWNLYNAKVRADSSRKEYFNKPIVLIIVAIIECILDDFVVRVREHVNDVIPNITYKQIVDFRIKKLDKFEHYITKAQQYNLFDQGTTFYNNLEFLRDVRNRLHIQNQKNKLNRDEFMIFTNENLHVAEKVFEIILEKMISKFPRSWNSKGPKIIFSEIPLPWKILLN